jgi:predicted permease
MTVRDLKLRLRALFAPGRVERELNDELAFHIERETEKNIQRGLPPDEARTRARARFGSPTVIADECRDERGIGFIDATTRDLQYAWRQIKRAPLAAATIVGTVALGLGLVGAIFTLESAYLFRVDEVLNVDELFAVERRNAENDPVGFTLRQYESLRRDTTMFTDLFAEKTGINTRVEGRAMGGRLVTANYFQMLGITAHRGRMMTPADEGRSVIVLSHRTWSNAFGADPGVIGRPLLIGGVRYEVIGVTPEGFRGLLIGPPDYWAPLSIISQFRPAVTGKELDTTVAIVGRLRPDVTVGAATAQLGAWLTQSSLIEPSKERDLRAVVRPRQGTVVTDFWEVLTVFVPLYFTFGLILLIACANVTNLLLARGLSRQKEIGIRLSIGASRRRIVRQLLTESLVLALIAAAVGYVVSRLVLAGVMFAVSVTLPVEIAENLGFNAPSADWRVFAFLIGGAVVSTVFFGLTPALQATRLELVRTMRGETSADARPSRIRNFLIAAQVGASTLLLVSSAIFLRSTLSASSAELGMRTADTILINVATESQRGAVVRAIADEPVIAAVAASWPETLAEPLAAFAKASTQRVPVIYRYASAEYFDLLDVPLLRGRRFGPEERAGDAGVVLVSETLAKQLWPDGSALGEVLRLEVDPRTELRQMDPPPLPPQPLTIVGIVRDIPGPRIARWPLSAVYLPADASQPRMSLTARVHGDPLRARQTLFDRLTTVDPALDDISTMRAMAGLETYLLGGLFWGTVVLGGLALALTVSGLFSVLSYLVEQRAKEIGVRMALGATRQAVTKMVLMQLLRHVGIGIAIGGGLAAVPAILLFSIPDFAFIADVVHVYDPIAYAGSIAFIIGSCVLAAWVPAQRAAGIDPIRTLRED